MNWLQAWKTNQQVSQIFAAAYASDKIITPKENKEMVKKVLDTDIAGLDSHTQTRFENTLAAIKFALGDIPLWQFGVINIRSNLGEGILYPFTKTLLGEIQRTNLWTRLDQNTQFILFKTAFASNHSDESVRQLFFETVMDPTVTAQDWKKSGKTGESIITALVEKSLNDTIEENPFFAIYSPAKRTMVKHIEFPTQASEKPKVTIEFGVADEDLEPYSNLSNILQSIRKEVSKEAKKVFPDFDFQVQIVQEKTDEFPVPRAETQEALVKSFLKKLNAEGIQVEKDQFEFTQTNFKLGLFDITFHKEANQDKAAIERALRLVSKKIEEAGEIEYNQYHSAMPVKGIRIQVQ